MLPSAENYDFPFMNDSSDVPEYCGCSLDDVPSVLDELGYELLHLDMRTTKRTTSFKIHGVYIIVFLHESAVYLMSGTYNHICALEGRESIMDTMLYQNHSANDMKRWSKWDNPMHNLKREAWEEMWKHCRRFHDVPTLHEYIKKYMKRWDDIGTTLYWARMPKEVVRRGET